MAPENMWNASFLRPIFTVTTVSNTGETGDIHYYVALNVGHTVSGWGIKTNIWSLKEDIGYSVKTLILNFDLDRACYSLGEKDSRKHLCCVKVS